MRMCVLEDFGNQVNILNINIAWFNISQLLHACFSLVLPTFCPDVLQSILFSETFTKALASLQLKLNAEAVFSRNNGFLKAGFNFTTAKQLKKKIDQSCEMTQLKSCKLGSSWLKSLRGGKKRRLPVIQGFLRILLDHPSGRILAVTLLSWDDRIQNLEILKALAVSEQSFGEE